jgi:hypothetical protein
MINTVLEKYENEKKIIMETIKKPDLLEYFAEEIASIEMEQKKRGKFAKGKKRIVQDFNEDYINNYIKKLMNPKKNQKFIKYLINNNVTGCLDIKNDPEIVSKILNICDYPELFKKIDEDEKLIFVKKLHQLIKDLEFPKNYCFDRVYYWRFEKTHCQTVKRDRKWFNEKLPIFEKTWNNIKFLKENPDISEMVFKYINNLPAVEEHFGNQIKDNDKVMKFINFVCDKPSDKTNLKIYNKKIKEIMDAN